MGPSLSERNGPSVVNTEATLPGLFAGWAWPVHIGQDLRPCIVSSNRGRRTGAALDCGQIAGR
jgi:hypothetical protein